MGKGRHRRPSIKGRHRRPSAAASAAKYAGTVSAAGIISATLASAPASASTASSPVFSGAAVVAAVENFQADLRLKEQEHLFHLHHLAHLARLKLLAEEKVTSSPVSGGGYYSCSQLETLWDEAGGPHQDAFLAAEIAMAESGGYTYAVSPADDRGLWQINEPSWGPQAASFTPILNAESAVRISGDGTNWAPWVTYTQGLYYGRC